MRKNSTWIKFIVVGTELSILILTGIFLGNKLDSYLDTLPIFTILGVIIGSISGFTLMFKLIGRSDKSNGKEE